MNKNNKKGRGSTKNIHNRFEQLQYVQEHAEGIDEWEEAEGKERTKHLEVFPKSILNKVNSPDVPGNWGMNPYQGCEHGCSYCYARNSHEYWGYNASLDFERVLLYKRNASQLLKDALNKKSWKAEPIMLSGNTDCYQPLERKMKITRSLLEVCLNYHQSISIITKNALIVRDIDLLKEMAKEEIVHVAISINALDEKLRSKLEPRTSTYANRLKTIETLSHQGIPVRALIAPVIPGLTDHQILPLAKKCADAGAKAVGYTFIRLNGHLATLFGQWLEAHYPDRKEKVLSLIKQSHKGKLNDNEFGQRMRGEGPISESIRQQIDTAKKRFFPMNEMPELRREKFEIPTSQFRLF